MFEEVLEGNVEVKCLTALFEAAREQEANGGRACERLTSQSKLQGDTPHADCRLATLLVDDSDSKVPARVEHGLDVSARRIVRARCEELACVSVLQDGSAGKGQYVLLSAASHRIPGSASMI